MSDITNMIVAISFAFTCFSLGYTLGRNSSKANK